MRNLRETSIKPLWVEDYYDGPLSGFCEYRGRPYYYVVQDDDWKCFMHPLKDETWNVYMERNEDFCMYVGDHWNDTFKGKGGAKPESEWHKFYDKWNKVELPKADELTPAYRFFMHGGSSRRRKMIRRGWRMERLMEARCRSSTGT
jgi:hypothetical protein